MKIFITGLGLIGGSLAKALKANIECTIWAYDSNETSINRALADKAIDFGYTDLQNKVFDADIVIVATPPAIVVETIEKLLPHFGENTLFTDVSSVKGDIYDKIGELNCDFVGGHPMAGTEFSGYENSKADLFKNAYYILTESSLSVKEVNSWGKSPNGAKMLKLVEAVGAKPVIIPYEKHDYLVGAISHIPHVVSAGLVNLVYANNEDETLTKLAGGGFRDITRISSSSEYLWQQIIFENKENSLKLLGQYENIIADFKKALENDNIDAIIEYFRQAREFRVKF
jgi:prephenate dehydrogenase